MGYGIFLENPNMKTCQQQCLRHIFHIAVCSHRQGYKCRLCPSLTTLKGEHHVVWHKYCSELNPVCGIRFQHYESIFWPPLTHLFPFFLTMKIEWVIVKASSSFEFHNDNNIKVSIAFQNINPTLYDIISRVFSAETKP